MEWIDSLIQRFSGRQKHQATPPTDKDIQGILDGLSEAPELLARELEVHPDCPDDEAMSRFLSRRCDRGEKERILEHMMTCHACLAAVDDLTREARLSARAEVPRVQPVVSRPTRRARPKSWALGFATPLAACCILLAVVFSRPAVQMELEVTRNALRTETPRSVDDGGLLHEGDRFRVEVSGLQDGYFFLYAWNQARGGKFIFPVQGLADDNRIRRGQSVFVPDGKGWLLEDAMPGTETFFLLFSEQAVPSEDITRLDVRLERVAQDRAAIEDLLEEHFSIEQRVSYHVE